MKQITSLYYLFLCLFLHSFLRQYPFLHNIMDELQCCILMSKEESVRQEKIIAQVTMMDYVERHLEYIQGPLTLLHEIFLSMMLQHLMLRSQIFWQQLVIDIHKSSSKDMSSLEISVSRLKILLLKQIYEVVC